jgi:hypothetical protein
MQLTCASSSSVGRPSPAAVSHDRARRYRRKTSRRTRQYCASAVASTRSNAAHTRPESAVIVAEIVLRAAVPGGEHRATDRPTRRTRPRRSWARCSAGCSHAAPGGPGIRSVGGRQATSGSSEDPAPKPRSPARFEQRKPPLGAVFLVFGLRRALLGAG